MNAQRLRAALPYALPALVIVAFVVHRVFVALTAGDLVYPIEPSEAKNTQIAWDLMTGRFGEHGYELRSYIANSGSVHHASYSSTALVYFAVSKVTGFTLLSVRLVPLLFWTGALVLWLGLLVRLLGTATATLAGVGLFLVPTLFIGFQLTFLGCHSESVLPLTALIAAWMFWTAHDGSDWRRWAILGVAGGYCVIFSYLLWPIVGLLLAVSLLPPRPRGDRRAWLALAAGFAVGLWPLWLILVLDHRALTVSITEQQDTTLVNTAMGRGQGFEAFTSAWKQNLPYGHNDYWKAQNTAGAMHGGAQFEDRAYRLLVFGPLLLLPWALTEKRPLVRKLATLVAIVPPITYTWLAFASPWKPHIPVRYFVPFALLGFSAPAVGIGLAIERWKGGALARASAVVLALACGGALLWVAGPRIEEAKAAVRMDRLDALQEHRYVTYYNLGMGNVWPQQAPEVNDLLDVRTAQGDPEGFFGLQAALWGSGGQRLGLGLGNWDPPEYVWDAMRGGISEWHERQQWKPVEEWESPPKVATNIGWGTGILTGWDAAAAARIAAAAAASSDWPTVLAWERFWEGYGFGWGRARDDAPTTVDAVPDVLPEEFREAIIRGVREGRELGDVPAATGEPLFASIRGCAT